MKMVTEQSPIIIARQHFWSLISEYPIEHDEMSYRVASLLNYCHLNNVVIPDDLWITTRSLMSYVFYGMFKSMACYQEAGNITMALRTRYDLRKMMALVKNIPAASWHSSNSSQILLNFLCFVYPSYTSRLASDQGKIDWN